MNPRTIKASEVRKGMRVRVEEFLGSRTTQVTEGPVLCVDLGYSDEVGLALDGTTFGLDPDHPVTVLAEPEPEWVEGAWYWTTVEDAPPALRYRVAGGWAAKGSQNDRPLWRDDRDAVTVLGRVLIVDWPGDDVAKGVVRGFPAGGDRDFAVFSNMVAAKVADAIRTQGGVR